MTDNKPSLSRDPLLNFRLAYLRAIARSWSDPDFRKSLLEAPDIQCLLKQNLRSFWPHLAIRVQVDPDPRKQTRWLPEETAGWIGPCDKFVITLPKKPDSDEIEVLAAYYQWFPDLMGPTSDVPTSGQGQDIDEGLGIPGGEKGSLLAFGGVVLRALALAWHDEQFMQELTTDEKLQPDAAPVLSKWLGYNNPFNFFLLFQEDQNETFRWDPSKKKLQVTEKDKPNTIVLNLPVAPDDAKIWPIALTSYNNTGPAYPFTCA
jgi:ribosomally synthesized peptide (two-chain TOMM family)